MAPPREPNSLSRLVRSYLTVLPVGPPAARARETELLAAHQERAALALARYSRQMLFAVVKTGPASVPVESMHAHLAANIALHPAPYPQLQRMRVQALEITWAYSLRTTEPTPAGWSQALAPLYDLANASRDSEADDPWFLVCSQMGTVTGMGLKHLAATAGTTYEELLRRIALMVEAEPHPWL